MIHKEYALVFVVVLLFCAQGIQAGTRMEVSPSLTVSEKYSTNVNLDEDDEQESWISTISPGLTLSWLGKRFTSNITYAPSFVYYDHDESNSTIRHKGIFNTQMQPSKYVSLSLSDTFTWTDQARTVQNATGDGQGIGLIDQETDFEDTYYTNTASAAIDVSPWRSTDFGVQYNNALREEREPYVRHTASEYQEYRFGPKDRVRTAYRYRQVDSRYEDTDDSQSHRPSLNLDYWLSDHLGLENSASYTRTTYSGDNGGANDDFQEVSGSSRLVRAFSRHFSGSLVYSHTYHDFDEEGEGDYHIYNPAVGIDWDIAENSYVKTDIGYFYRRITEDNATREDQRGLTADGEVGTAWRVKRGSLSLTGSTGYDEDYQGAENLGFSVFYQAQADAEYQLTEKLGLFAEADLRRDEYLDQEPERTDTRQSYNAGVRYSLTRWLSLTLRNSFRQLDSDEEDREYTEYRSILSLSFAPRPYRID